MLHPRSLILKFLLLTLVIIATVFLIKPNSKLFVKAASPCPTQDSTQSQIQISSGFLSLTGSSTGYASGTDSNSNCLIDAQANIDSEFLSYDTLYQTYYTNLTSVKKVTVAQSSDIKLNIPGSTILYSAANQQNISIPATAIAGVYVVFIDGSLHITGNITSPSDSGVIFVVNGPINIDSGVTEVDAFIIDYGAFCDNWNVNTCSTTKGEIDFHGSIISINPGTLLFSRAALDPNTNPTAETIAYDSKYFALFKDIFSKDKTIWTEIK